MFATTHGTPGQAKDTKGHKGKTKKKMTGARVQLWQLAMAMSR
jgi:hypothetical protein